MHFIHKWEHYPNKEVDSFLGERYERHVSQLRMCSVCKKAQEFCWDSQGGGWATLKGERLSIFHKKRKSDLYSITKQKKQNNQENTNDNNNSN